MRTIAVLSAYIAIREHNRVGQSSPSVHHHLNMTRLTKDVPNPNAPNQNGYPLMTSHVGGINQKVEVVMGERQEGQDEKDVGVGEEGMLGSEDVSDGWGKKDEAVEGAAGSTR